MNRRSISAAFVRTLVFFVVSSGVPIRADDALKAEAAPSAGHGMEKVVSSATDPWVLFDGKLRWSAQERLRAEWRENNFDFDRGINSLTDDAWLLQRFRLGLTARPVEPLTLMAEGQDAREFGSARPNVPGALGAEGDDEFDLRQAWLQLADLKTFPAGLKAGRMPWGYGDQRLIGESDWGNFGRVFDGAVVFAEFGKARLDVFFGSPVLTQPTKLNPDDGHDRLAGVYFSSKEWLGQTTEFYVLRRRHTNAINNGQAQETWTPGVRASSRPGAYGGWDYEGEFAGQAGTVASSTTPFISKPHEAFASHIQGGYTWSEDAWKPRVGLLYDYASGNSDPNGSTDTSFQGLFPTNHKFYGGMDLFAWRNIHDGALSLSCEPRLGVSVKLELHTFWLAETADAWYRANGFTVVRPAAAGRNVSGHVGEEVDFVLGWKINRFLTLGGGYSHFFADGFPRATGKASDADFGYLQLTAGF
ncbi:MAG: alginate export family protein [Verrucomicrobiae bacterium]|nr:alginate export family protein [Verrucomicrobiae bacterium]